jgi:L-ascorbate metabolism protein UlaG (beta-lactamase superfamily)
MRFWLISLLFGAGFFTWASSAWAASSPEQMLAKIHWLGQATVKIEAGGKIIYIDPYQLEQPDHADIVLITHSHEDHLAPGAIAKIAQATTRFIAPQSCVASLESKFKTTVTVVEPGNVVDIGDIHIAAVPAYNVVKTNFHPKANKWVGYLLKIDGVTIYHAGDTERIPEMKDLTCDIALLPLGQTYTMNSVQDAADAALDVKTKIAVPIHYGLYEGQAGDAETFKQILEGKVTVVVKPNE